MVKEIICKNGEVALCDDEDYPLLSRFTWYMGSEMKYSAGYPCCFIYGKKNTRKQIFMHQLVGAGLTNLDHINRDKLDNRRCNLRNATSQQNSANVPKRKATKGKPCSSIYKGVHKWQGKYRAVIGFNKKAIQLGTYEQEEEAALAYNKKAKELFGEFAWLNPVPDINQHA